MPPDRENDSEIPCGRLRAATTEDVSASISMGLSQIGICSGRHTSGEMSLLLVIDIHDGAATYLPAENLCGIGNCFCKSNFRGHRV